jgi:hypothetical protein
MWWISRPWCRCVTALASTLSPSCGGSGGLRWPVILHRTPYGITAADAPDETDLGWGADRRYRKADANVCASNMRMALAGLWDSWRSPAGERVRSFAIITTAPNELCAQLHNRMPAILAPEAWPEWLGEQPADEARLKSLLAPTLPTA